MVVLEAHITAAAVKVALVLEAAVKVDLSYGGNGGGGGGGGGAFDATVSAYAGTGGNVGSGGGGREMAL